MHCFLSHSASADQKDVSDEGSQDSEDEEGRAFVLESRVSVPINGTDTEKGWKDASQRKLGKFEPHLHVTPAHFEHEFLIVAARDGQVEKKGHCAETSSEEDLGEFRLGTDSDESLKYCVGRRKERQSGFSEAREESESTSDSDSDEQISRKKRRIGS